MYLKCKMKAILSRPQCVVLTHRSSLHDDVIQWKHFLRNWPFVRGIHRSLVNSPHKGQWRGASMSSLICAWLNGRVNNCGAGDLRRRRGHYDVTVMDVTGLRMVKTWGSSITDMIYLISGHVISSVKIGSCSLIVAVHLHTEVETKWPAFCKQHFQMFLKEIVWISSMYIIWLMLILRIPVNNNSELAQVMAWRRTGGKLYLFNYDPLHWRNFCVTRPQWFKDLFESAHADVTGPKW